ncbi:MAG: sulfotransferase, partial [Alphaproteobacteria bacterium]|nr:sulfotransferase [Alphaproteobacteria bacterium]
PAAIALVRQAIAADGSTPLYHCNLGEMCRLAGCLDDAVAAARQALALRPQYPEALNNLGIAHYERGAHDEAIAHYRRAIGLAPSYAEAHSNLGNALRARKKVEEALPSYRRAIALKPGYADAYNNLGTALRDLKRIAEAEAAYRQAMALNPLDPLTLNNLALAVKDLDRPDEALTMLMQSAAIQPDNHQTQTYLASILVEQHRLVEARIAIERALALRPDDPEATNILGNVSFAEGHSDRALDCFRKAIAWKPDLADAYNNMGNALKELGRFEEARAAYVRSLELDGKSTGAYLNLADAKEFTPGDAHLEAMEAMAAEIDRLSKTDQMQLHFALSKAYADIKRHGDAFRHMLQGNALKRCNVFYDEPATLALFGAIRASFTPELMRRKKGDGDPSPTPIFILGMPRSGTTLVEQILASHPQVFGGGELGHMHALVQEMGTRDHAGRLYPDFVPSMTRAQLRRFGESYLGRVRPLAPEAMRITDKMPSNYYYIGLIHLALPNARIIHTIRDPADTCLSCFSKLFSGEQNHTYDLGELGRYYRAYAELMEHWRQVLPTGVMIDIRYEDVVADLETQARRIVAHAGLEWDEACLAFDKNRRAVKTASAIQVRRPIYRSSIGRWHVYKDLLSPLLDELPIAAPRGEKG